MPYSFSLKILCLTTEDLFVLLSGKVVDEFTKGENRRELRFRKWALSGQGIKEIFDNSATTPGLVLHLGMPEVSKLPLLTRLIEFSMLSTAHKRSSRVSPRSPN
jgi:hypothetical protein